MATPAQVRDEGPTSGSDAIPGGRGAPAPSVAAAIFGAVAAGDKVRALELLRAAYGRRCYGLAYRMVRDAALAEDVMQEALVQMFSGLETLRRPDRLHAWVMTVVAHRSLDAIRKRNRRGHQVDVAPTEVAGDEITPLDRMARREERRALEASLEVLSPRVRAAVLLRFGQELSFEAIGTILGEAPDTVRAQVTRALPRLRSRLSQLDAAARRPRAAARATSPAAPPRRR